MGYLFICVKLYIGTTGCQAMGMGLVLESLDSLHPNWFGNFERTLDNDRFRTNFESRTTELPFE